MSFPKGLRYIPETLSPKHQKLLIDLIDGEEWSTDLGRRTQHYGYKYSYSISEPQTAKLTRTTPPPPALHCLAEVLYRNKILKDYPNQIIVNEYEPGQGIGKHRDHHPIFGYDVATMSLGSGLEMQFEPYKNFKKKLPNEPLKIYLEPGSVLVFGGDARYKYSHEIKKRKSDTVDGRKIKRGKRISITFRHVNEEYREQS